MVQYFDFHRIPLSAGVSGWWKTLDCIVVKRMKAKSNVDCLPLSFGTYCNIFFVLHVVRFKYILIRLTPF